MIGQLPLPPVPSNLGLTPRDHSFSAALLTGFQELTSKVQLSFQIPTYVPLRSVFPLLGRPLLS